MARFFPQIASATLRADAMTGLLGAILALPHRGPVRLQPPSGHRLDVDRALIDRGLSNVIGSLFSCHVSCGWLNRSLPNYIAGARIGCLLAGAAFLTRPLRERAEGRFFEVEGPVQ